MSQLTLKRPRPPRPDWSHRRLRWTFASPSIIFILAMVAVPVLFTLYLSLTDARGAVTRPHDFIGLQNYLTLLGDFERFWPAVTRTFVFTIVAVSIQLVVGMAVALLLVKPFAGQKWVRVTVLLPVVATPVAVGMMWMMIFQPTIGLANEVMRWFGLPESAWTSDPSIALILIILVDTWQWAPMVALILLAGLVSLPEEPFEAATIDGANGWQRFVHITLPLLKPTLFAALLLRAIDALKTFDILYTIKGSGGGSANEVETLNLYGYALSFQYSQYGLASALLMIFFVLIIGVSVLFMMLQRRTR